MGALLNGSDLESGSGDGPEFNCSHPTSSPSVDKLLFAVYILLAFVGTAGSIMVCLSVRITPNLRKTWNYILVNLSVADMIGTGLYLPMKAVDLIQHYRDICDIEILRAVHDIVINVSFSASLLVITLASIERAIAVVRPFEHSRIMPRYGIKIMLVGIWLVAFVFGVGGGLYFPHFTSFISIPLYVIMLTCYTTIFVVIKRRKGPLVRHTKDNELEKRIVTTIAAVTVVFTIFWAPMFGFLLSGLGSTWEDIAFPVAASSAVFNPLVYCYRNKEYRKAFKRIILCQCRSRISRGRSSTSTGSRGSDFHSPTIRSISVLSFVQSRSETGKSTN